jgi:hypothetical protein
MLTLSIIMDGDSAWPDLKKKDESGELVQVSTGLQIAVLSRVEKDAPTTVCLRVDLPDGRTVLAETTLRLLATAVRAFQSRYPNNEVG